MKTGSGKVPAVCREAGDMKVLFTASIMGHLTNFHVPYMQYFKDKGFDVHIACGSGSPPPCADRHYEISFERSPFKPKNLACYRSLKRIIDDNAYDVIHCHTPVVGVLTRLAARAARKKGTVVIYTAHGFHFYQGAPRVSATLFRVVEKWLSRYTDILITINSEDYSAAARYELAPARGTYKVPGVGVDVTRFLPQTAESKEMSRMRNGISLDAFVLIFAGEYSRDKNQTMLLETVSMLKDSIPQILLLLPGRGPMQSELELAAVSMGITDNVWLMGYRTDMDKLLCTADVAVSSSVREGLGINLVEAMATSLPVVATRIRGHVDLITDGENGFLVEPGNAREMADRLLELYRSPQLRSDMGRRAIDMVKPYLLKNAKADTCRIYDSVTEHLTQPAHANSDSNTNNEKQLRHKAVWSDGETIE